MPRHPTSPLTRRESEVLQWILDGKYDGDIALILGISPKTVNFHVENAKRKLGVSHRVRAIALALKAGLLDFPGSEAAQPGDARRAHGPAPGMPPIHIC